MLDGVGQTVARVNLNLCTCFSYKIRLVSGKYCHKQLQNVELFFLSNKRQKQKLVHLDYKVKQKDRHQSKLKSTKTIVLKPGA